MIPVLDFVPIGLLFEGLFPHVLGALLEQAGNPRGAAGGGHPLSRLTRTGTEESVRVPLPSCPTWFHPQAQTVPAVVSPYAE